MSNHFWSLNFLSAFIAGEQLRRVPELQVLHPVSRLRPDLLPLRRVLHPQVFLAVLVRGHLKAVREVSI